MKKKDYSEETITSNECALTYKLTNGWIAYIITDNRHSYGVIVQTEKSDLFLPNTEVVLANDGYELRPFEPRDFKDTFEVRDVRTRKA
jgi:hypothetical protein